MQSQILNLTLRVLYIEQKNATSNANGNANGNAFGNAFSTVTLVISEVDCSLTLYEGFYGTQLA
eukprot:629417-Amorphochlora_amoeboformis.AAC.1